MWQIDARQFAATLGTLPALYIRFCLRKYGKRPLLAAFYLKQSVISLIVAWHLAYLALDKESMPF